MARNRILDFMQSYRFWLFDLVPSMAPPFYVLGAPFFGFSAISSPEYSAQVDSITQLNSMFKKYSYGGGEMSPITLSRGVRGFDDTMWQWMYRALTGLETTQRHLLLLSYTNINLYNIDPVTGIGKQFDSSGIQNPFEIGEFLPGKAWLLWGCIPSAYKSASDFDANSPDVSISELTIQPEAVTELTALDPI
ncbi:MAG: phage tail protein [Dehalococcoidales bacterium]|nr:phage tail protein [Dehalococcoidales bacterium]